MNAIDGGALEPKQVCTTCGTACGACYAEQLAEANDDCEDLLSMLGSAVQAIDSLVIRIESSRHVCPDLVSVAKLAKEIANKYRDRAVSS